MSGYKDTHDVSGQPNVPQYDAGTLVDIARHLRTTAKRYLDDKANAADMDRAVAEWIAARQSGRAS